MTTIIKKNLNNRIKFYAGTAAVIGASPIPGSDAVLLTGVQMKMAYDIMKAYGIEAEMEAIIGEILMGKVVSMLGKAVAGSIIKMIPGVGTVIGGAVNATVASSITYTIGKGLCAAAEMICDNGWENSPNKIAGAVRMSI